MRPLHPAYPAAIRGKLGGAVEIVAGGDVDCLFGLHVYRDESVPNFRRQGLGVVLFDRQDPSRICLTIRQRAYSRGARIAESSACLGDLLDMTCGRIKFMQILRLPIRKDDMSIESDHGRAAILMNFGSSVISSNFSLGLGSYMVGF